MAMLVLVMTFARTLLDLNYKRILADALAGKEQKTAFFGRLYGWVNLLAVTIQLVVTNPLLRLAGPIPALLPLPIAAGGAFVAIWLSPTLPTVVPFWIGGAALIYSLNQSAKELLYVPTPLEVKYGAKAYIDVFVFRLGDGLASVLMILLGQALAAGGLPLLIVGGATALGWLVVVAWARRGYRRRTPREIVDISGEGVDISGISRGRTLT